MTQMPRVATGPRASRSPAAEWRDLTAEFDRWGEAGRVAPVWWRDDDAVSVTPELRNLLRIADGAPVALAVVPAYARPELAATLRGAPRVAVLQHGWRHDNRAREGKKSEYPAELPADVAAVEIAAGRARLLELFGDRALPVFVPPWNRVAPGLLPLLVKAGIGAVSTFAAGLTAEMPAGLAQLDVHVDVTDWKGSRGFVGTAAALGSLVHWLRAFRLGAARPAVPVGILTHHMIMDRGTIDFLEDLRRSVGDHEAACWTGIAEFL